MDNPTARQYFSLLLLAATSLAAAVLLTSCESIGGGGYGPGAGFFDTVVVDAGHGGIDRGAKASSGACEKALTLDTAHRLAEILRAEGFRVIETRTTDDFVSLGMRTAISNGARQSVFVCVHYNWAPRSAAHGIEIYYNSRKSTRLAANILREVLGAYNTQSRGIKSHGYYVMRHNQRPAVLCELGFLSCPSENRYLQNPAVRQRLAESIAAGVIAEKNDRQP